MEFNSFKKCCHQRKLLFLGEENWTQRENKIFFMKISCKKWRCLCQNTWYLQEAKKCWWGEKIFHSPNFFNAKFYHYCISDASYDEDFSCGKTLVDEDYASKLILQMNLWVLMKRTPIQKARVTRILSRVNHIMGMINHRLHFKTWIIMLPHTNLLDQNEVL